MASNHFGQIFRITTWGESHGKAVGVVIDGCPAGLELSEEDLQPDLDRRAPGQPHTSPRKEPDCAQILSGVFEGKTTGTPISILIPNQDADSSKYESTKQLLRPGHANYTYLEKYGLFDYRGGGRASARETVCRVAAGSVAKKLLMHYGISITASVTHIGGEEIRDPEQIALLVSKAKEAGDSLGGIIEFSVLELPAGLGDPVYEKLEANLAKALMSLPATKGFELGSGFHAASMKGSAHNDSFVNEGGIKTETNHAGGTLGGISTGMPLIGRVAFKPTSSIVHKQSTVDMQGKSATFELPAGSRHDPCVALRAVPIVEAMVALVLADALLLQRTSRLS